jgi:hypothetical protein
MSLTVAAGTPATFLREIENEAVRCICRQNEAALGTTALYLCVLPLPPSNPGKDHGHNQTARGRNQDIALPPALSVPTRGVSDE